MTLPPMLLANLNVFFTCFILLAVYGAGPLMILRSLAIFPFVGPRASGNLFLVWPLGLFMIWSSRASPVG